MNTVNIFTGAFSDEPGQRLLRILQDAYDTTFTEMHDRSSQCMERYQSCLARVESWDRSVTADEVQRLKHKFPDADVVFRAVFVSYVKAMRASKTIRLILNPPRLDQVLQRVFTHFAKHRAVHNAHYFSTPSIVEKRVICMDAIRGVLFDLSGEDHVKIAPAPPPRPSAPQSTVQSAVQSNNPVSPDDDQASRVVSNVCDDSLGPDDIDSIGPDDSVSCADFAEKQHRQLDRMRKIAAPAPIAEEEDDRESKTSLSLSLSSVSITEKGPVMKKTPSVASSTSSSSSVRSYNRHASSRPPPPVDHMRKIEESSDVSSAVEDSEASSVPPPIDRSRRHTKKSRSYVTSLTNDDSD